MTLCRRCGTWQPLDLCQPCIDHGPLANPDLVIRRSRGIVAAATVLGLMDEIGARHGVKP